MPTATVDVDPDTYLSAGDAFLAVNDAVCDLVSAAATAAGSGGGMAGTDSGGVDWAAGYDEAAASALQTGATLAESIGRLGDLLTASGTNHADADAASTVAGPPTYAGDAGSGSRAVSVIPATPPSADGTDDDPPAGWFLVAHLLQYAWPNGHQDRLRSVASGWNDGATRLSDAADRLSRPIGDIAALQSPEIDAAVTTCCDVQRSARSLADAFTTLGTACSDYATHLDDAHSAVIEELAEYAAQSAGLQLLSALAAPVTAGASEIAGQAAQAARTALAASRIGRILQKLLDVVRTVTAAVRAVASRIGDVLRKLREVLAKGTEGSVAEIASKVTSTLAARLNRATVWKAGRMPEDGGPPGGLLVKLASDGRISNYTEYDEFGRAVKRVDLTGRTHGPFPTPHVQEYTRNVLPDGTVRVGKGPVRPATPEEVP